MSNCRTLIEIKTEQAMNKTTDRLLHLIRQAQRRYSENYLVLAVPGFMSKKFIAYCSMKEDLELILQYISEMRNNPHGTTKSALSYSLIALYGKCFTDASKNNFPKLEPSHLFAEGELNYITHNYLMELRHKFIAHRGEIDSEVGISYMLIPKVGSVEKTQVRFNQLKMVGFPKKDLDNIEILIKFLIEKIFKKIEKSAEKIKDGMLNTFTTKELSLMTMNGKE